MTDTGRTRIHTHQHLNPHPIGDNQSPWNLTIPETKLIPLLAIQTKATTVITPNWVNQTDLMVWAAPMDQEALEVLAVLEVPMVQEVPAVPVTTLQMSKISCENS